MIVRKTTPQEQPQLDELFAVAFEQPLDRSQQPSTDSRVHSWGAFGEEGQLMSALCVTDFTVRFDGGSCKMGGVGGVSTYPQYRRQGGIRGCFQAALPEMYQNGYELSYLYPFSTAYYRKFGYECCVQKLNTFLDLGLLKVPPQDGQFRLATAANPMTQQIRQLDQLWERRYNLMVLHQEQDYQWTTKQDPAATGEYTYVYFDGQGRPKAYTTFRMANQPDGRNLPCSRFCFEDKQGFLGLMSLFQSLAADHRLAKFQLPWGSAMEYLCPEWAMGAAWWTVERGGMVRVIHVEKVLEKARYLGSGTLTLEIRDPQIPENNGRFRLVFENGQAAQVSRTEQAPDLRLDISAFSAMICGVCSFDDARAHLSGVEVLRETGCASQVFYPKHAMIVDYF